MKLSYYIETFGCQMNKNDSEIMSASFQNNGFIPSGSVDDADIVVYNTCSVRQHAEDRVLARISSGKKNIKKHNGLIVVAGCMAQRIGNALIKDRTADIVIGPYQVPEIGSIVKNYLSDCRENRFLSQKPGDFTDRISVNSINPSEGRSWHKWITITHGCENFCSYCIVPYVRGPLISFKSNQIIEYLKRLISGGIKEVTLLGQNVNQYGSDTGDIPFFRLLERAASLDGLVRVNFLTSHPKDFSAEIIRVIRDNPVISSSIHLPLQSGSDNVLKMMNRKYNMEHYMGIIKLIRKELNDYAVTTDLIVGFPGETDKYYRETLKYVEEIEFDDAFMYAYSAREDTPAFTLHDPLAREQKIERLNRLIEIQRAISKKKLTARINMKEKMIVEKISKKSSYEVMGKTFLNHPVVLPGSSEDIGKDILIKIISIKGSTLQGKRIA